MTRIADATPAMPNTTCHSIIQRFRVRVLFPVTVLCFPVRRKRFTLTLCIAFAIALAAQFYASRFSARPNEELGASLQNLALIVCDRIILAGAFAEPGHRHVYLAGRTHGTLVAGLICLLALAVVALAARKAPWELKLFGLASLGIVVGGCYHRSRPTADLSGWS
ncbi:MAG: hypothetical protein ACYDH4_11225 [Candidatus Cryosericum sp.]|jgi:hypothetical protein